MSRKRIVLEAISRLHADAVHYGPHEGSHTKFRIHKVGSNFSNHVKPGDVVHSGAIDDLADAGAKLKQVKHVKEEVSIDEASPNNSKAHEAYTRAHDELGKHIEKLKQLHADMHPSKVEKQASFYGRGVHWGHVGDINSHMDLIKRITEPER